jgi:hypothetical protein
MKQEVPGTKSLKTRLLVAIFFILLCSIVLMGVVSVNVAMNESNDAVIKAVKGRLISQNVQTALAFQYDFKKYRPTYDALAGFAFSSIYYNSQAISVLIFQMPKERINSVLTHNILWSQKDFGEPGKTYLVNDNWLMIIGL